MVVFAVATFVTPQVTNNKITPSSWRTIADRLASKPAKAPGTGEPAPMIHVPPTDPVPQTPVRCLRADVDRIRRIRAKCIDAEQTPLLPTETTVIQRGRYLCTAFALSDLRKAVVSSHPGVAVELAYIEGRSLAYLKATGERCAVGSQTQIY